MSDNVIGFLLAIAGVIFLICAIRGCYNILLDITKGLTKWDAKVRNAKPDSPIEAAVRETLNNMIADPSKWATSVAEREAYRGGPNGREQIIRTDGRVKIKYYHGDCPEIHMESIGEISTDVLKPELIEYIRVTCQGFKHLVAAHELLKPETVKTERLD